MPDMRFAPPNPLRIADRVGGLNAPSVRGHNERLVLSLLLQGGGTTRLEIGQKTGLSAQTVSVIVRSLEMEGLVARGEVQRGRMGPPTTPMLLNPEGAFSIGVSLGREGADVVLIDFTGGVRYHRMHRYDDLPQDRNILPLQRPIADAMRSVPPLLQARVAGIGLAVPEDARFGVGVAKLLGGDPVRAHAELEKALALPIFLQNDVTAAASGESLFGAAHQLSDFVFFYLGSQLHARLVLCHQIHNGRASDGRDGVMFGLGPLPVASAGWEVDPVVLASWVDECRDRIVGSTMALLNFVEVPTLVLSTYAPRLLVERLKAELVAALPGMQIVTGRETTAPKAWGAASLPYQSRFMVQ